MKIYCNSFNYGVSFVKENVFSALTDRQKAIAAIVALALGCLAACWAMKRFFFNSTNTQHGSKSIQHTSNYLKNLFEDPKDFDQLPILDSNKINSSQYPSIKPTDMSDPIMQGEDANNRKMIAVRFRVTTPSDLHVKQYTKQLLDLMNKDKKGDFVEERVLIFFQYDQTNQKSWRTTQHSALSNLSLLEDPFSMSGSIDITTGPVDPQDKECFENLQSLIKAKRFEDKNNGRVFELY